MIKEITKERLEDLFVNRKMTNKQVAIELGITESRVNVYKKKYDLLEPIKNNHKHIKLYNNKEWLYEQYIEKDLSRQEIANLCNCGSTMIATKIKEFNIYKFVKNTNEFFNSKELLYDEYIIKKTPLKIIQEKCGVSETQLYKQLKLFGIGKRVRSNITDLKKEELYEMYIVQKKSIKDICKHFKVGRGTFYIFLKKYGIESNRVEYYDTPLKKNKSNEIKKLRGKGNYVKWSEAVLKKDHFCCQCCGSSDNLEVHHIFNFATYPELRLDVDNGIVLCQKHHNMTIKGSYHNIFGTSNNNDIQLETYINNYDLYEGVK